MAAPAVDSESMPPASPWARLAAQRRTAGRVAAGVTVLAGLTRLSDFHLALPYWVHYDEAKVADVALHLLQNRTLDPEFLLYPGLFLYLVAAGEAALVWVQSVTGGAPVAEAIAALTTFDPSLYNVSRTLAFVAAVIGFPLIYCVGTRMGASPREGRLIGLVALAFVAVNSLHAVYSHIGKADLLLTVWLLAGTLYNLRIADASRATSVRTLRAWYAASGVLCGLALGTHYAAPVFAPLLIAHGARLYRGESPWRRAIDAPLVLAGIAAAVTFTAVAPYSVLHCDQLPGIVAEERYRSVVTSWYHAWRRVGVISLGLQMVFTLGLPLCALTFWGMAAGFRRIPVRMAILTSFCLVYLIARGVMYGMTSYQFALMTPPLALAAAYPVARLLNAAARRRWMTGSVIACGTILYGALYFGSYPAEMHRPHQRATPWLADHVRADDSVAVFTMLFPTPAFPGQEHFYWPQELSRDLLQRTAPDVIVISRFNVRGFEKPYYRARMPEVADTLYALLDNKLGYRLAARFPAPYFHQSLYIRLDIEKEFEMLIFTRDAAH